MELSKLTVADREIITELFRDVFTNEPWNDDWSDGDQLYAYITDLTGQSYSLTFGYFDGDQLVVLFNGFHKKGQKIPKKEIEKAKRIKKEYDRRTNQ